MSQIEVKQIWRWVDGLPTSQDLDVLSWEEPLEIRVNDEPVSVTMRTPGHDSELAAGFLLTEGLIQSNRDIEDIGHIPQRPHGLVAIDGHGASGPSNVLNVQLSRGAGFDTSSLSRHVFASSSCGICGKATIESIHQHFPPISSSFAFPAEKLPGLISRLEEAQVTFAQTGGLHAAAIFNESGEIIVSREDVGRHNAVDKVIGFGLKENMLPFDRHVLLVSGRSSFEILQKALAAQIPIVAAVSAPSSLAVEFAKSSGQTLVGFLRGNRMNVYCGNERITPRSDPALDERD